MLKNSGGMKVVLTGVNGYDLGSASKALGYGGYNVVLLHQHIAF